MGPTPVVPFAIIDSQLSFICTEWNGICHYLRGYLGWRWCRHPQCKAPRRKGFLLAICVRTWILHFSYQYISIHMYFYNGFYDYNQDYLAKCEFPLVYLWYYSSIIKLASVGFMEALVSEDKRILAVYPVFLFYLFLSWYCLIVNWWIIYIRILNCYFY